MSRTVTGIPPLAGLASYEEAARPGVSVDDNVALLRRFNRVEVKLYELSAAFMNPTPEWEVKGALSLHLYLDAEHSQALRTRVSELRKPPHHLDEPADAPLEALLNELLTAKSTVEMLTGVFRVIRPALLSSYREHLENINPVFDFPTARLLRQSISEEAQMIAWGNEALSAVLVDETAQQEATLWEAHLRSYLAAAGGITGDQTVLKNPLMPAARFTGVFAPTFEPKRDSRSGEIYNFHYRANAVYNDSAAGWDERNLALMWKRFHEMDVPEMMASIILETPGKPWDYYREMSRQLWDEARHSMMGEVWMAKHGVDWSRYPNHVGWSLHLNLDRTPIERHLTLYFIEQSLMNGKTGKREEWRIATQAADPLATYFQDYDWADEVLHAQIGRKWLKPELGAVKDLLGYAREITERPTPTLESRRSTAVQEDWWPLIVRDVLGHESTSVTGIEDALTPKFQSLASG